MFTLVKLYSCMYPRCTHPQMLWVVNSGFNMSKCNGKCIEQFYTEPSYFLTVLYLQWTIFNKLINIPLYCSSASVLTYLIFSLDFNVIICQTFTFSKFNIKLFSSLIEIPLRKKCISYIFSTQNVLQEHFHASYYFTHFVEEAFYLMQEKLGNTKVVISQRWHTIL